MTLAGLALRLMGLNKADGLWYDELLTYSSATASFPAGILHQLSEKDFHAPLYYLGLHAWIVLFRENETLIRFSSVIFGVLILPLLYLIGRELGSRKGGLVAAMLASVNSCLIYYSQELRFYSLLPCLAALAALFAVRIIKTGRASSCLGLAVTNLLILYTYTLGVLYVGLQLVVLGLHLLRLGQRLTLRRLAIIHAAAFLLYVPYLPTLLRFARGTSRSIVGDFWWVQMGPASPILILQDWFTPILANLRSHPVGYYRQMFAHGVDLFTISFIVVPMAIGLAACFRTALRKDTARVLLLNAVLYFGVEMTLAYLGKMGPMTRHTIIVLPLVIVAAGMGLAGMKHRRLSAVLLGGYVSLCLAYLLFGVASASTAPRDGYRKYIAEIGKYAPTTNDVLIIPYGSRPFASYYANGKAQLVPFDVEDLFVNGADLDRVFDAARIGALSYAPEKDKVVLRSHLATSRPSPELDRYFRSNVVARAGSNGRLFFVISGQINPFQPSDVNQITRRDDLYQRVPLYLMLTSKTINDLLRLSCTYMTPLARRDYGGWELCVFEARAESPERTLLP